MKRIFTIVLLLAVCSMLGNAAVVTTSQAQRIASEFLSKATKHSISSDQLTMVARAAKRVPGATAATPAYYVFNASQAFVVVAGDDRMPAVLGYSDNGVIDPNDMPDGLKDLLESYTVDAAHLDDVDALLPQPNGGVARTPIAPMVKAQWGQSSPFNTACPYLQDKNTYAVTGCVATAMAQVMYYHKWPPTVSSDIPAYTTSELGLALPALDASSFPGWSGVKGYYTQVEAGESAKAVAKIMRFVGQSLEMDYNTSSAAHTSHIPAVLSAYFRYAPTAQYVQRINYTAEQWATILYNELAARRPVVYRGHTLSGGGHAYVCDGMDANGLVHINWGWYGKSDGYFLLTALNPSAQGIGSTMSNDGYINESAMVIGITPEHSPAHYDTEMPIKCAKHEVTTSVYSRSNASMPFNSVSVTCRFSNASNVNQDFVCGMGLYDTHGNLVKAYQTKTFNQLMPNYGSTGTHTFNVDATVPAGSYYLKPIVRMASETAWRVAVGGEVNFFLVAITNTKLTLSLGGNLAAPSYKVNSVAFNGIKETKRTIEFLANVTNTGSNLFRYLYLMVDNNCETMAQCAIEPGQTDDIIMHFTPTTAGSHSVKLCYDEAGTQVLWQGTVNVATAATHSISVSSLFVSNAKSGTYTIEDNTMQLSCRVSNNGSFYDDYIQCNIYRHTTGNSGSLLQSVVEKMAMAGGVKLTMSFIFDGLQLGEKYFVTVNYYSKGELVRAASTTWYTVANVYDKLDVNKDNSIDIADANIVINVILGDSSSDRYNRADVNSSGTVDINDLNQIISAISQ